MKRLDVLLLILCIFLAVRNPHIQLKEKTVTSKPNGITIGKTYKETKSITPIVLNKNKTKHATTFREYIDSDGRTSSSITHSVRVGKEYYVSTSVNMRESSYGQQNYGTNVSFTKYW